jgi:hypothetical protein
MIGPGGLTLQQEFEFLVGGRGQRTARIWRGATNRPWHRRASGNAVRRGG